MGLLPSRGKIIYDGAAFAAGDVEERVARARGAGARRTELFAAMSVADNLELGGFQRYRAGDERAPRRSPTFTIAFRGLPSGGTNLQARCPVVSGRCSPWAAR
jgi:ABC-type branched-subunit amino acid transport system ATPase component